MGSVAQVTVFVNVLQVWVVSNTPLRSWQQWDWWQNLQAQQPSVAAR